MKVNFQYILDIMKYLNKDLNQTSTINEITY